LLIKIIFQQAVTSGMSRYIPVSLRHSVAGFEIPAVGCACPWKPKFWRLHISSKKDATLILYEKGDEFGRKRYFRENFGRLQ
jgi:hypothetical protein